MLGLGSYSYRWSCGFRDRRPSHPLGPVDLLHRARGLDLGLVQFADNIPLHERDATTIATLRDTAAEAGIVIELGMGGFEGDLLQRYLALAEQLDARLIRIALDAGDAAIPVADLAARVMAVLPAARAAGVRLAVENHFHFPSPRLRQLVEMVDDPALGICLDVANSICAGEWPAETISLLAPFAINLHLKDYEILPDPYGVGFRIVGTPLGQGVLDIPAVFTELARHGREVNVILEHWLPHADTEQETMQREDDWIAQSVACARQHVA
ncbi:MAG: sugar phosphate isomerase/epimerase family protein [Paracoccaceae bacterium]